MQAQTDLRGHLYFKHRHVQELVVQRLADQTLCTEDRGFSPPAYMAPLLRDRCPVVDNQITS